MNKQRLTTKQLAAKKRELVKKLNEIFLGARRVKRPRGRPRREMKIREKSIVEEYVLPSRIGKKYRTLASKVKKYITNTRLLKVVEEYKKKLFERIKEISKSKGDKRIIRSKVLQRAADSINFRFRKPTKLEKELTPDEVLPSQLFGKKIKSTSDIELYQRERNEKLDTDRYVFNVNIHDEDINVNKIASQISSHIISDIEENKKGYGFYVNLKLDAVFSISTPDGSRTSIPVYLSSLTHRREEVFVSRRQELYKVIRLCLTEAINRIGSTASGSSDAVFESINKIEVKLFRYHGKKIIQITQEPAPVGYRYRELPEWVRRSTSVINIQNKDDTCFKWCIVRNFHRERNPHRISKKLKEEAEKFEWFGLDNPETFNEQNLCKFEDKYNFRIIIFSISDEPGYKVMHLRNDKENPKYTKIYLGHYIDHFFLITNIKGFVGCGLRKVNTINKAFYICEICYSTFHKQSALDKHFRRCLNSPPEYKLPEKEYTCFMNYKHMLQYNAVCYADFEATTLPDGRQLPNSFCIFCPDFEILEVRYAEDPAVLFEDFWKILEDVYERLKQRYKENEKLYENPNLFVRPEGCGFCKKTNITLLKYYDCFTGKFIDFVCRECNSKMKKPKKIRVFFHNLKGYDSHFIIKYGIKQYSEEEIEPLGKSKEKLFSIKVGKFIFLDTYCHLPFSLSQLIKDYVSERKFAKFLPDWYKHKEAYPYEWFNNFQKFEITEFPPREVFFSRLNNKHISEKDYQEAFEIYQKYCKTFKDYHDVYLRGDVVFLAEVFEKYRELSLSTYHLDPVWYVSGPAYFYDAMKYMTKAKLPLIDNQTLYDLIKSGIRGGICGIGEKDIASADQNNTCILALDCVNLYGKAMMEPLPKEIIEYSRWMEVKQKFDSERYEFIENKEPTKEILWLINNAPKDTSFIFCVDIEVDIELHDKFKAYPLFPERINDKLLQTLLKKEKYVVLDRYLKFGIEQGYKVTKIHAIIEFKKEAYMKPYIEFNTEQRRIATEKKELSKVAYFKNANNMVFGKNIENAEKYSSYIIYRGDSAIDFYNQPEKYKDFIIIDDAEPILLFDKKRDRINLNKPIIIGFCILDISKHIMAEHFFRLRQIYGDKMKLLYTDTDSFYLEINMPEKEAIDLLRQHEEYFELPDSKIKKVPGKMALEKTCKYFRAFAAKHYIVDKEEKCKGVPKHCTTTEKKMTREYYQIKSKEHTISLNKVIKKISYTDNKKIHLDNIIVPIGYKGLNFN